MKTLYLTVVPLNRGGVEEVLVANRELAEALHINNFTGRGYKPSIDEVVVYASFRELERAGFKIWKPCDACQGVPIYDHQPDCSRHELCSMEYCQCENCKCPRLPCNVCGETAPSVAYVGR